MRVFISGIMQGSRLEQGIASQDYRAQLTRLLREHVDGVDIFDPFARHPESVSYDPETGRRTLLELVDEAGRADVLVAFVPEASMGTALEMWQAHQRRRPVFTISPLRENWVVRFLSTRVFETYDQFAEFVASGELDRAVRP